MKDRTLATAWVCTIVTVMWIIVGLAAGRTPGESNTGPVGLGVLFLAGWTSLILGRIWAWWTLVAMLSGMSLWMSAQLLGVSLYDREIFWDFSALGVITLLTFAIPLLLLLSDPPLRWASEPRDTHRERV